MLVAVVAGAGRLRDAGDAGRRRRACSAFIFGLLRIAWIIVASIFLYDVAVETGQFQVMKESIAALSSDKRLQLILIAFCFGAFLEGTGGGGAPVAIAGSFLIGLGFEPFQAATLCLVANTAPVAWGGVGNPIRVLAGVTGLPEPALSAMTGRILPPLSADPAALAGAEHGRLARDVRGLAGPARQRPARSPACSSTGRTTRRPGLVDIVAALVSLLVDGRLPEGLAADGRSSTRPARVRGRGAAAIAAPFDRAPSLKGWSPFLLASVFIFVAALPAVNRPLTFAGAEAADARACTTWSCRVPAGRARRRRPRTRSPT